MILNGHNDVPEPMRDVYPDGGMAVGDYACEDPRFVITAHAGGVFRVWLSGEHSVEWFYYPIRVVGMAQEEVARAIYAACVMLDRPMNRAARRARAAAH
jgi:hypothetical protein